MPTSATVSSTSGRQKATGDTQGAWHSNCRSTVKHHVVAAVTMKHFIAIKLKMKVWASIFRFEPTKSAILPYESILLFHTVLTCQISNPTSASFGPPIAYAAARFNPLYFSLAVSNKVCTCGAWPFSNTRIVAPSSVCSVYKSSGLKTLLLSVRPQSRPLPILSGWKLT